MKGLTYFLLPVLALLLSLPVEAYEIKEPEEYDFKDTQIYLTREDDRQEIATGVCYGPLYEIRSDAGSRVGGFLRSCTVISFNTAATEGEASPAAAVSLIDLMGINLSVVYDPFRQEFLYGFGISIMEFNTRLSR